MFSVGNGNGQWRYFPLKKKYRWVIYMFLSHKSWMNVSAADFCLAGFALVGSSPPKNSLTLLRRFKSFYGISPFLCSLVWYYLCYFFKPRGVKFQYLLWCLLHLKTYNTDEFLCTLCGVDKKTFRKWTKKFWNIYLIWSRLW